ncbi:16S rRNA processing protein RimM [Desulfitispora alkaliphila]|uniref:ribosome maturation factor RimM n=1 Tax=Desulfitispora alkaliphila TaxID=622674 RepID=UPI003D2211C7
MVMISVGKVTKPHGVKGELKVIPLTDDTNRFKELKEVFMTQDKVNGKKVTIESYKHLKQFVILKFKEFDNINQVEEFRNHFICIPESELPQLPEDTFYRFHLIGLKVIDVKGNYLGVVNEIIETGANDVLWLKDTPQGKNILIPAIKSVVVKVDMEEKVIVVDPPLGLIEE